MLSYLYIIQPMKNIPIFEVHSSRTDVFENNILLKDKKDLSPQVIIENYRYVTAIATPEESIPPFNLEA